MAGITDKFTETFNGANPNSTTVASPRSAGVTTLTAGNLAGWPTNTAVHFATYKTDTSGNKIAGSQIDWKGIVTSTTNIGTLTRQGGAADTAGNAIGDIVEMMPTASWANDLAKGLEVQHNQDGSHGATTHTSIANSGGYTQSGSGANTFTGATTLSGGTVLNNNDVQANELATNAITLGSAQITGNTSTSSTTPAQITGLSVTVTVPSGSRKIRISAYIPWFTLAAGGYANLTLWDGTVGSGTQLQQWQAKLADNTVSQAAYIVTPPLTVAPGSKTYNAAYTTGTTTVIQANCSSTSPGFILVEAI